MNKEGIEVMEEYRQRILDLEQQNAELREGIQHNQNRIIDLLEQLHSPEGKPTKEMKRQSKEKKMASQRPRVTPEANYDCIPEWVNNLSDEEKQRRIQKQREMFGQRKR